MPELDLRREEDEQEEPKRSAPPAVPLPLMLGIVLGVALLVGGGTLAAIMVLRPGTAIAATEGAEEAGLEATAAVPADRMGNAYVAFDAPFIVNLRPDDQIPYDYLKFEVALEVANDSVASALAARMPKMKAVITGLMNNVPYNEVSSARGQRKYQDRIAQELNLEMRIKGVEPSPVYAVYFTTLVAQ